MTNAFAVCLISILFFCGIGLSNARQTPKECSKGPEYWCESLRRAADCGAVQHCIGTVWEQERVTVKDNDVSEKIVRLFRQLKDVKDMINDDYLGTRVSSACRDVPSPAILSLCKENTAELQQYMSHVLQSDTSPETMCRIIGMCNNAKLDSLISKKKTEEHTKQKPHLLGATKCTWGPSYWCSNFSTGRECKMTHHCVQRVWSKMAYPQDDDGICKICKDMVKQARDQLQSNETQEELKEVFEGECKLIPIKIVTKECIKLADDFVPELVETLSSEMNPQAVCSVAGLCNNANIDNLLEDYNTALKNREGCSNCKRTVGIMRKRFDETTYEDFLVGLLQACQKLGSLSDSCSMLSFKYYENIIAGLKKDLNPQSVCHLSGQCSHLYHSHNLYTFPEDSKHFKASDDIPCEFCEQVVEHLRDTLVANSTELEFHKILTGVCKHTGEFKSECLQLVDQYFETAYNFLVSEMKSAEVCSLMGICTNKTDVDIAPLLPKELAIKAVTMSTRLIGQDEANSYVTPAPSKKQENIQIMGTEVTQVPVLPIERMFVSVPRSDTICSFCQYFLHYIQVELSDDNTEEAIKKAVEGACDVLPQSINDECRQFVTEYGPAVIALLVQEIDPASVCPAVGLCPKTEEVRRVDINAQKSNCPLCLFAVEQLETMLKNNRSEDNIRKALDGLCNHLSTKLRTECVDFVDTYTKQLVEMLVADLNAQEICVYLKLCTDNKKHIDPLALSDSAKGKTEPPTLGHPSIDKFHDSPILRGDRNNRRRPMLPKYMLENGVGDIATNAIPDNTINGRPIEKSDKTICVICEFVLKEIDDQIKDKHNDDEIKKVVHGVCKHMPKAVRPDCDEFVEKYSDLVISLLAQEMNPDEVCRELKLCTSSLQKLKEEILDCAVCETVVMAVKKVLGNDKVDRNIVHIVEKACNALPAKYYDRCHTMLEIYGAGVIRLIEEFGTKDVCKKIGLCSAADAALVRMRRTKG
ncbi:unnamed protein product, partial [Brenthis ino]